MKKTSCFMFFVSCFLLLAFFSCKDSGPGGQPPPSGQDKIVWSEAENVVSDSSQSLKSQKALPEAGMFKGLYKGPDDESQSQGAGAKTFYVKSLIDDKVTQLTPDISYASNAQKLGLAPNGDFWFWTEQGIFISNVNSDPPRPVIILAAQQAAKNPPINSSIDGIYKIDPASAGPASAGIEFVSDPSNNDRYFAFIEYSVSVDTNAEEGSVFYNVVLKYDSADGSVKSLFPFSLDGQFWRWSAAEDVVGAFLASSGDKNILGGSGLYYILLITKAGAQSLFLVRYDPFADKHYLQYGEQGEFSGAGTCKLTAGKCRMTKPLLVDVAKCDAMIDKSLPVETATSNAKKAVIDCVNAELGKQKVTVADVSLMNKDVTGYFASKDEVKKIGTAGLGESAQLFSIDANKLKNISGETDGASIISCDTAKCFYKEMWVKDEKKALVTINSDGHFGKSAFYFKGYSSGSSQALYKVNYSDGAVTVVGEVATYFYPHYFEDSDGNTIIFYSGGENSNGNIYFESAGKSFPIVSSKLISFSSNFVDMSDGWPVWSNGIVKDGSKAIVQAKEAEGDSKKYWFNLSDVQSGKELTLNPMISDTYSSANLKMIWKGYAFWQDSTNGFIVNRPFDENKNEKVIKSIKGNNFELLASVVGAFKPPAELGFDISVDFGNVFKCGSGGEFALYCAGSNEMCEGGACVAKNIVECAAHADCKKYGYCVSGKCSSLNCNAQYFSCPVGATCNADTSFCKGLAHVDECSDDQQCGYNKACLSDSAKGYNICKDKKTACTADKDCLLGFKCSANYCEALANADECAVDEQCAVDAEKVCLKDSALGYKTCQEKKVAGACTADADCSAGFICGSAGVCLPVMKNLTVKNESVDSPIVETDKMTFKIKADWTKLTDFSSQEIQKYFYKVKNLATETETIAKTEVQTNSANFIVSIPGNKKSYAHSIMVWPAINNITNIDIEKIKKSKTISIGNSTHCNLPSADTTKCPSGYTCTSNNKCCSTCQGKQCGDNGCGIPCGTCPAGFTCNAGGFCGNP